MNVRTAVPALIPAVLALALPGAASAAPAVTGEFPLGGGAVPHRLAAGSDGNMWVVIDGDGANDVARVKPDGTVDKFDVSNISNPGGITSGPDGDLWVTMNAKVGHFSPNTPTVGTAFTVADIADPRELAFGTDGFLYTGVTNKILKIKTDGSSITPLTATGLTGARGASLGADGNIYIGDQATGKIFSATTTGTVTSFDSNPGLQDVQAGLGGQVAFSAPVSNPERVGIVTPPAAAKTIDVAANAFDPTGITLGLDGAYWMANFAGSNLTRLTPSGEYTVFTGFTANSGTRYVEAGPNGTLWVSEETAGKVARVSGVEAPPVTTPPTGTTTQPDTTTTPPVVQDTTAPVITRLTVPRKARTGASLSFTLALDSPASVTAQLQRRGSGRRNAAGRCVAPTRRLKRARGCIRWVTARTVTRSLGAGPANLRIATSKSGARLPVGQYRVVITATDVAGNVSRRVSRVVKLVP